MADQVLTKEELQDLFAVVTESITDLSPDGKKGQIRFGYPQDGQPAWSQDDDVICIIVSPQNNPYDKQRDTEEDGTDPEGCVVKTKYTRVFQVMWCIFGPNSFQLADKLKTELLWEPAVETMEASAVAPLTEIDGPTYVPYNFQGQWWERTDLRASFNVGTRRERVVGYIQAVDILIYTDKGLQRTVHAPPEQPLMGAANAVANVTGDLTQEEP